MDFIQEQAIKNDRQLENQSVIEYKAKIEELEDEMMRLKEENDSLRRELSDSDGSKDIASIVASYENVMGQLIQDHETVKSERDLVKNHLANLEKAFYDLVQKYERAKNVIKTLEKNEETFHKNLQKYKDNVDQAEKKYMEFKEYAIDKLNEANIQLEMNNKEYLEEMSKMRTKAIQSQIKVNDLEKKLSKSSLKSSEEADNDDSENCSIFDPLTNDIT
ncbi:transforming acidic coiled-coil-containing protein 1-like [Onthophagus taurus]|uniref:transforming acidic coiled-coil-containing protein 1-like n=1 Tax=Onthophagus taurus TaxID=166361 RepID=UPI0039BE1F43